MYQAVPADHGATGIGVQPGSASSRAKRSVPVRRRRSPCVGRCQVAVRGDALLSLILSKALMLAADDKIKDPSITRQIGLVA